MARKPNIDFEMIGISVGSTLTRAWEEDKSTCIVVESSPTKVVYNGEVVSLSQATEQALGFKYGEIADCWKYEGETLAARRKRFEDYHCNHE